MNLTKREKWWMRNVWALSQADYYDTFDDWIKAAAGDTGETVEKHLAYDAEQRYPTRKRCGASVPPGGEV